MKKQISINTLFAILGIWLNIGAASAPAQTNCTSPLSDAYYTKYTVVEAAAYVETNAAGPVLAISNGYIFTASVNLKTNYTASGATVAVPGQGLQTMKTANSRLFTLTAAESSFSNLSAAYPGGGYTFVVSNDVTTVDLPDNFTLPNAPTLSDYAANQSIDPTRDFTLSWNPFAGGQAKDIIMVDVVGDAGTVFQAASYGCPGALDGTAASVVIPANTLATNQIYRAEIVFVNVLMLDTNSTPDVALLSGTEAETEATISTGGGASPVSAPAVLTNAASLPGGAIRFDVATTPGVTYTVQFSPTLADSAPWTSLLTTQAAGNLLSFTNTPGPGFYRATHN